MCNQNHSKMQSFLLLSEEWHPGLSLKPLSSDRPVISETSKFRSFLRSWSAIYHPTLPVPGQFLHSKTDDLPLATPLQKSHSAQELQMNLLGSVILLTSAFKLPLQTAHRKKKKARAWSWVLTPVWRGHPQRSDTVRTTGWMGSKVDLAQGPAACRNELTNCFIWRKLHAVRSFCRGNVLRLSLSFNYPHDLTLQI